MARDNTPGLHLFGGEPPMSGGTDAGRVFWVGNAPTPVPGGTTGVDVSSYGWQPQSPFATLDYAIGQCVAGRGDTIFVLPGHAETVAGTIAADVAGVRIRGLGVGQNRPTLTFDTTTDVLAVSVANVEIAGLIFVCNVASLVAFITLAAGADGAWIHQNLFREGSATGLSMIEFTGAADDVVIEDNAFYAPTAGNYDEAILIASTPTRGVIRRNVIYGDWDEGGINNAAGNVATLFNIAENHVTNLLTNVPAINLDSAVTGQLVNNRLFTDTQATALDPGSMGIAGNLWHAPGTDTEGVPPLAPVDAGSNFIGADNANNAAATTNVVGNAAGSILERLEEIRSQLSGTVGVATFPAAAAPANSVSLAEVLREMYDLQDKCVVNTTAVLVNGTTLFTIAGGPIEILSLVARCVTANDGTASTLQWSADPTDGAAATFSGASASLASAAAGAMVVLNGTALSTAPTVNATGVGLGMTVFNGIVIGAGIITSVIGVGSTTGTWQMHLRYRPLARGVTVS